MRVSEIMTTQVQTIRPNDSARLAANRMKADNIHHLVVVDGKKLVGIISAHDVGRVEQRQYENTTVSELMTRDVISATPTMLVRRAANVMRGRSIGSLPVLEDGKLVGIVTVSDLLELISRGTLASKVPMRTDVPNQLWRRGHRNPPRRVAPRSV